MTWQNVKQLAILSFKWQISSLDRSTSLKCPTAWHLISQWTDPGPLFSWPGMCKSMAACHFSGSPFCSLQYVIIFFICVDTAVILLARRQARARPSVLNWTAIATVSYENLIISLSCHIPAYFALRASKTQRSLARSLIFTSKLFHTLVVNASFTSWYCTHSGTHRWDKWYFVSRVFNFFSVNNIWPAILSQRLLSLSPIFLTSSLD